MADIFSLGTFIINVSKYFKDVEEKKQAQLMDDLAENPDIDMVEYREQLEYLQATLNREMPLKETTPIVVIEDFNWKVYNILEKSKELTQQIEDLQTSIEEPTKSELDIPPVEESNV